MKGTKKLTTKQAWEYLAKKTTPRSVLGLCVRLDSLLDAGRITDSQWFDMGEAIVDQVRLSSYGEYGWLLTPKGNAQRRAWALAQAKRCRR